MYILSKEANQMLKILGTKDLIKNEIEEVIENSMNYSSLKTITINYLESEEKTIIKKSDISLYKVEQIESSLYLRFMDINSKWKSIDIKYIETIKDGRKNILWSYKQLPNTEIKQIIPNKKVSNTNFDSYYIVIVNNQVQSEYKGIGIKGEYIESLYIPNDFTEIVVTEEVNNKNMEGENMSINNKELEDILESIQHFLKFDKVISFSLNKELNQINCKYESSRYHKNFTTIIYKGDENKNYKYQSLQVYNALIELYPEATEIKQIIELTTVCKSENREVIKIQKGDKISYCHIENNILTMRKSRYDKPKEFILTLSKKELQNLFPNVEINTKTQISYDGQKFFTEKCTLILEVANLLDSKNTDNTLNFINLNSTHKTLITIECDKAIIKHLIGSTIWKTSTKDIIKDFGHKDVKSYIEHLKKFGYKEIKDISMYTEDNKMTNLEDPQIEKWNNKLNTTEKINHQLEVLKRVVLRRKKESLNLEPISCNGYIISKILQEQGFKCQFKRPQYDKCYYDIKNSSNDFISVIFKDIKGNKEYYKINCSIENSIKQEVI